MDQGRDGEPGSGDRRPRWVVDALLLGLFLSLRGYHSLDGDQAYRLPLLLHRQDPGVYAHDPFVTALDAFNPHRGWLMVLDVLTRPLGLSAGLLVLFVLTFLLTCRAVDRLAGAAWPESIKGAGWIAVGLLLAAKAGNIGTNHLFEGMVLDRLAAWALGWQALAEAASSPSAGARRPAMAIGLATWIHPSVGLQLAMFLGASWVSWAALDRTGEVGIKRALRAALTLGLAAVPGLVVNLPRASALDGGLSHEEFWLLSVELQNPQHMLPHLWRMPQWLSWSCYLVLAGLQLGGLGLPKTAEVDGRPAAAPGLAPVGRRLAIALAVILAGLGAAWFAIEVLHLVPVTIFQPFRMATPARGIALIIIAGRVVALWRDGGRTARLRAVLLVTGFLGDWLLVMVTAAEAALSMVRSIRVRIGLGISWHAVEIVVFGAALARGIHFLGHHDTESGHIPLLTALAVGLLVGFESRRSGALPGLPAGRGIGRMSRSLPVALAAAWAIPLAALLAGTMPEDHPARQHRWVRSLIDRCRLAAVPRDDMERLALWCRDHTPRSSRFIGPPGPKTFRLWSRRTLAFNRAASPYHGAGLADWFARFQDHVDFHGPPAEFVRAYLADRHRFEARYQALSEAERAALAVRQGASYVVAASPPGGDRLRGDSPGRGPLELLHVEGRYAVYRVRSEEVVQRHR